MAQIMKHHGWGQNLLNAVSVVTILLPFGVVLFRRNRVKREAQGLNRKLQKEIDNLKKTMDELDNKTDLQVSPENQTIMASDSMLLCVYTAVQILNIHF